MKKKPRLPEGNALRELDAMQNRLRALFSGSGDEHGWNPGFELSESTSDYILTVDTDGVEKDQVEVALEDGYVMVTCRHKSEAAPYLRRIQIPEEVESGSIRAELRDGILTVTLPKGEKNTSSTSGNRELPLE